MIVAYLWEDLTPAQQEDAVRGRQDIGRDGKPPSGAEATWWCFDGKEWSWKGAIFPDDHRRGIKIGTPAGAPAPMADMPQAIYLVTPAAPPSWTERLVKVAEISPPAVTQAPRAKRKGRR